MLLVTGYLLFFERSAAESRRVGGVSSRQAFSPEPVEGLEQ